MTTSKPIAYAAALAAFVFVVGGCASAPQDETPIPPMSNKRFEAPPIAAEAGIPVAVVQDPQFAETKKVSATRAFGSRPDAFALLPTEVVYERAQVAARVVGEQGNFALFYTPPPPAQDVTETFEPQPYRRLSGVLLGDGVLALIEMEDGRTYDVRPGMQIPNSEWTVVSIDTDKAILRRAGDKRPNRIAVRLESRPVGTPAGGGGGGGGARGGGGTRQD